MIDENAANLDRELLQRIQRRDDQAIASLYDRYSTTVYSIAHRMLRDTVLAEQILLDVFTEIWRRPEHFMQVAGSLSFSLVMMARNRALATLLRDSDPITDAIFPEWIASHPSRSMTREEARAAIDELPPERRLMLEKAFFEGAARPAGAMRNLPVPNDQAETAAVAKLAGTGLEVTDVESDPAFARRHLHVRDSILHLQGLNRLARVFVEEPATILQELVAAAVELCGADSAGISVVQENSTEDNFYHWVATAGQYSGFLNAKLPRYPSACGVTLARARPQIFRVSQRFFDLMGIQAPTVTDGLLLPWQTGETRGTIWIMAHGREEAFDGEDARMMQVLADFAATGVKLQHKRKLLLEEARTAGEAAMANSLAQLLREPLHELMQTVCRFSEENEESDAVAQQALGNLSKFSDLVQRL